MNDTPAVSARNLHLKYNGEDVLSGLNLTVDYESIFGILGPNGSGKTTLIYLMSTLLAPDEGTLELLGYSTSDARNEIRERIGIVFQTSQTDPLLTGRENLLFQANLYGVPRDEIRERANQLLKSMNLEGYAGDPVKQYSGGMQRKLEIAQGLIHKPNLLIMDEPGVGLDVQAKNQLYETLRSFIEEREDIAIVLATHDMNEAENCDRIGILNQGKTVKTGSPEKLKRNIQKNVLELEVPQPEPFVEDFQKSYSFPIHHSEDQVFIETDTAPELIPELVETYPDQIESVTFRKPTLSDVFLKLTGQRLESS